VTFVDQSALDTNIVLVTYDNSHDCRGQRTVPFPAGQRQSKAFTIDEGSVFTLYVGRSTKSGVAACASIYTIQMSAGHEYRVVADVRLEDLKCTFRASSRPAGSNGEWLAVASVYERKPRLPFLSSGGWCEADKRFQ
jgi:hypothetical protein